MLHSTHRNLPSMNTRNFHGCRSIHSILPCIPSLVSLAMKDKRWEEAAQAATKAFAITKGLLVLGTVAIIR